MRGNMWFASASPLQVMVALAKYRVRPKRYEIFARCINTTEVVPSFGEHVRLSAA